MNTSAIHPTLNSFMRAISGVRNSQVTVATIMYIRLMGQI